MALADINTKPTQEMANEAEQALEWRAEFGRGGTEVGVARARDLKNRVNLSIRTIKRMFSYLSRHEVDKKGKDFIKEMRVILVLVELLGDCGEEILVLLGLKEK